MEWESVLLKVGRNGCEEGEIRKGIGRFHEAVWIRRDRFGLGISERARNVSLPAICVGSIRQSLIFLFTLSQWLQRYFSQ